MTKKLLGFIRTETAQAIGFVFVALLVVWAVGCESTVRSLSDPETMVTRSQLTAEVESYALFAEQRFAALDKKDEFRKGLFDALALYATTGALNPAGVVAAIFGILGVGAIADNVRKRTIIKTIKRVNGDI